MGTIHFKTASEIAAPILEQLAGGTPLSNWNEGGTGRTVVEAFSGAMSADQAGLYADLEQAAAGAYLVNATGSQLDMRAAEFGRTRIPAIYTEGVAFFGRSLVTPDPVAIPQGTVCRTLRDRTGKAFCYSTTAPVILPGGEQWVSAPIIATEPGPGPGGMVGPGSIQRIEPPIPNGIDIVENRTGWVTVAGVNEETDDQLKARALLAWIVDTHGYSETTLEEIAFSIPGVLKVAIIPLGQGRTRILILTAGPIPDPAVVAAVQAAVDDPAHRAICALNLVSEVEKVPCDLVFLVTLRDDTLDKDFIEAEIRTRLGVYFTRWADDGTYPDIPILAVAEDVPMSQVIEIIMNIFGIYDLKIIPSADNIPISETQVATLGTITIYWETRPPK